MDRLGLTQLLLEPELMEAVQPDINLVTTLVGLGRVIPERSARDGARGRAGRHRRARGAAPVRDGPGRDGGAQPGGAHPPPAALRHRLEPHRRGQPQALPARARHRRARAPRRLRPAGAPRRAADHPLHRPVRLDGRVGRLLERLRRRARVAAVGRDEARRLRHRRRRPHRRARRPRRRALRRAARRRHRHQPGAGLLRGAHRAAGRDDPRAHQRPLRGRHRRGDGAPGLLDRGLGRDDGRAAGPQRLGPARFDANHAAALAAVGVPAFACTPDQFPDLMATAIEKRDITAWAAANDIVTTHEPDPTP